MSNIQKSDPAHLPRAKSTLAITPLIADTFLIFSALIYIPFLGRTSETQPLISTLIAFIVILTVLFKAAEKYTISKEALFYFLFIITIGYHALYISQSIKPVHMLRVLIGPAHLIAVIFLAPYATSRCLKFLAFYLFIFMIAGLFAPSIYEVLKTYLSTVRGAGTFGGRGLSLSTPEPTYAVLMLSYIMALTYYLKSNETISNKQFWKYICYFFLLFLLTLSSYALFLIVIFCATYVVKTKQWKLIIVSTLLLCILVYGVSTSDTRAGSLLNNLANVELSNFAMTLALADPSASTRFLTTSAALYGFWSFPFGYGPGAFERIYWIHFYDMGWDFISLHYNLGPWFRARIPITGAAYFPTIIHDYGIFGLSFILLLLKKIYTNAYKSSTSIAFLMVAVFMLTVQSSFTNPAPWAILGFLLSAKRPEKE